MRFTQTKQSAPREMTYRESKSRSKRFTINRGLPGAVFEEVPSILKQLAFDDVVRINLQRSADHDQRATQDTSEVSKRTHTAGLPQNTHLCESRANVFSRKSSRDRSCGALRSCECEYVAITTEVAALPPAAAAAAPPAAAAAVAVPAAAVAAEALLLLPADCCFASFSFCFEVEAAADAVFALDWCFLGAIAKDDNNLQSRCTGREVRCLQERELYKKQFTS
jgi:hypothetical protein